MAERSFQFQWPTHHYKEQGERCNCEEKMASQDLLSLQFEASGHPDGGVHQAPPSSRAQFSGAVRSRNRAPPSSWHCTAGQICCLLCGKAGRAEGYGTTLTPAEWTEAVYYPRHFCPLARTPEWIWRFCPSLSTVAMTGGKEVRLLDKRTPSYIWISDKQQFLFRIRVSQMGFLGGSVVKNLPASVGDVGSIPGSGRSPGVGNGNPL